MLSLVVGISFIFAVGLIYAVFKVFKKLMYKRW